MPDPRKVDIVFHGQHASFEIRDPADSIQRQLMESGVFYEADLLEVASGLLGPGAVVDVGANIGNHTVFFSAIKGRRVHAFEPHARSRDHLETNIALNAVEDLVVVDGRGLGRAPGRGSTSTPDPHNVGGTRIRLGQAPDASGNAADIVPLDSVPIDGSVALIKVDVEGMEGDVIAGALKTIAEHRPVLLVEVFDEEDLNQITTLVEPLHYELCGVYTQNPTLLLLPQERAAEAPAQDPAELIAMVVRQHGRFAHCHAALLNSRHRSMRDRAGGLRRRLIRQRET